MGERMDWSLKKTGRERVAGLQQMTSRQQEFPADGEVYTTCLGVVSWSQHCSRVYECVSDTKTQYVSATHN